MKNGEQVTSAGRGSRAAGSGRSPEAHAGSRRRSRELAARPAAVAPATSRRGSAPTRLSSFPREPKGPSLPGHASLPGRVTSGCSGAAARRGSRCSGRGSRRVAAVSPRPGGPPSPPPPLAGPPRRPGRGRPPQSRPSAGPRARPPRALRPPPPPRTASAPAPSPGPGRRRGRAECPGRPAGRPRAGG